MPDLSRDGDVFVLHLGDGENRFNPDFNAELSAALAEAVGAPPPRALVTTASGKFWSNGLDLDWMGSHEDRVQEAVDGYHTLLADWLGAGIPTVAAIGGHAFAAGAMLAAAHDATVMRADRGYWCVPEADIGLAFTPGMTALLSARLPRRTAHEAMTTARRYGGADAHAAGIVDAAVGEDEVLAVALERARALAAKNPDTLKTIKERLHAPALHALRAPQQL